MLTEEARGIMVDDVKAFFDAYRYTISEVEFNPHVEVYRYGENFTTENPYVMVQFLPTSRNKFRSLSDVTGIAKGKYKQFSFCQIELCSIHFYCNRTHQNAAKTVKVSGRLLGGDMAESLLERINKYWETLLWNWGACFDNRDMLIVKDLSGIGERNLTKIYNYDIDVYLRTQFKWDKVPDGYEPVEADALVLETDNEGIAGTISKKTVIRFS